MSVIDSLITNRTQADVKYVNILNKKGVSKMTPDELSGWINGLKGSYNASDMNRVGRAIEYLVNQLEEIGISVNAPAKTDWELSDIPTARQAAMYTQYVNRVRSALQMPDGTPTITNGLTNLTYEKANDIERILLAVDEMIHNVQDTIDLGWALGTSYTGLYAAAPSLRLMTESGDLLVDARDRPPDLLHLPDAGAGQLIIEYAGQNYLCEGT